MGRAIMGAVVSLDGFIAGAATLFVVGPGMPPTVCDGLETETLLNAAATGPWGSGVVTNLIRPELDAAGPELVTPPLA